VAEFLPPRMPEDDAQPVSQEPPHATPQPELYGDPEPPPPLDERLDEEALARATAVGTEREAGSLGRLISVIVSVGLAWALAVGITAWVLGLFLARG
jgi:hypothetical protein